jgi:hypothetical protein
VNRTALSEVCDGEGNVFILDNYNSVLQATLAPVSGSITEITISFIQKRKPVSIKDILPLSIEIHNIGKGEVVANSVIEILSGGFYHKFRQPIPSIPRNAKRLIDVDLDPRESELSSLPEFIQVCIAQNLFYCCDCCFVVMLPDLSRSPGGSLGSQWHSLRMQRWWFSS